MEQKRRIVVLGGGITGLTAGYEAVKAAAAARIEAEVTVLEAAPRAGGKVRTERHDSGLAFEAGPDSFITAKPQVLQMVRELGLEADLLPTHPTEKTVSVYMGGKLVPLPEGLMLILPTRIMPFAASPLLTWEGKARMALEPFVAPGTDADESLASFFRRRLGPEALDKLVAPMLAGIYAADAEKLSLRSTFPQFLEMERSGGLLRSMLRRRRAAPAPAAEGLTMFMTLKGGLSRLTETLASRLPAGCLQVDAPVRSLKKKGMGWEVATTRSVFQADSIIAALPANVLAPLLRPVDSELASALAEIPFASTATVTLAYDAKTFPVPVSGFGFLVPRAEGRKITAATYVSAKFPGRVPPGVILIRCFMGGAGREEEAQGEEAALARTARGELRDILGLGEKIHPLWTRAVRWPSASPQYNVGHAARLSRIAAALAGHRGLVLAGASYRGVGLPDCIQSARQAADQSLEPARAAAGVC